MSVAFNLVKFTHDESRLNNSNYHSLMLDLFSERLCPRGQTALGTRVHCDEGRRDSARHGSDIEDERFRTSLGRSSDQRGEDHSGELKRSQGVLSSVRVYEGTYDLDNRFELFGCRLGKRNGHLMRRPSVVHYMSALPRP